MTTLGSRSLTLGVTGFIATLGLVGCGGSSADPDDGRAEDPASATSAASSAATSSAIPGEESPTEAATPAESATPAAPAGLGAKAVAAAALKATRAGVPALVPAENPPGFAVTSARFLPGPGIWTMTFADAAGTEVILMESAASADELAAQFAAGLALESGPAVDLRDWGTGRWSSFTGSRGALLTKALREHAVSLSGADVETLTAVAKTLVTAEDSAPSGDE